MTKENDYRALQQQLASLLQGETDFVANLANTSALLYHSLPDCNWVGFYLLKENQLVLGPFQGKPACVRIELGKGVCGAAAQQRCSVVVPDVHLFDGHIACDTASQSEVVVPLIANDWLVGVLDIDSPIKHRFDDIDRQQLETVAAILLDASQLNLSSVKD